MNQELKEILISMKNRDAEIRALILKKQSLYDGYDEEMESLHIKHTEKLKEIINNYGWPGKSLVGKEGANAAFVIAQNSISKPEFQKYFLSELKKAVAKGEATPNQEACLEDRILFNQGKSCKYGMLFDWNSDGNLIANVDDEALVNERRAKLGLSTLAEAIKRHREEIENEGGGPPKNIQKHKQLEQEWAQRVGWR